jgi:membrane protein involved in colicin uptake
MKTNFKRIYIGVLVVLLALSFLLPVLSMAKNDNIDKNNKNSENGSKNAGINNAFCLRVENWVERVDQNLTRNQEKIADKQEERLQNMEEKKLQREEKLAEHREKWEQNREEQYTKLESKAQTDVQKQAIVEFKQAVEAAISARKEDVDAAISAFRTGLDQLINNRKTATENAKNAYRNTYQVAVQKAKDDCAAGVDANQVRTTFMAALKAGKDKYNSDRQAIEKISTKTLVETRQTAFKKALDDFKAAMQAAKDKLRAAFLTTEED